MDVKIFERMKWMDINVAFLVYAVMGILTFILGWLVFNPKMKKAYLQRLIVSVLAFVASVINIFYSATFENISLGGLIICSLVFLVLAILNACIYFESLARKKLKLQKDESWF